MSSLSAKNLVQNKINLKLVKCAPFHKYNFTKLHHSFPNVFLPFDVVYLINKINVLYWTMDIPNLVCRKKILFLIKKAIYFVYKIITQSYRNSYAIRTLTSDEKKSSNAGTYKK